MMKFYLPCLIVALFFSPHFTFSQKSIRLINKGKYEKAEQLSLQQLQALKLKDVGRDLSVPLLPHLLTKRITPYHSLGLIHKLKGDFTASEQYLIKADSVYDLFETAINKKKQSTSWIPTIRYSTYGIEIIQNKQEKRHYIREITQARIFMVLGELPAAKSLLDNTSSAMTAKYGRKTSMGKTVYSGLGEYFMLMAQYDSGRHYYEKYITALHSDPNYFDTSIKRLGDAYYGLAQSYVGTGDLKKAVLAGKKSYRYANHRFVKSTDGKNYLGKVAASNQLAEAYRLQNNYKEALAWNSKAFNLYNNHINMASPEKLPVLATRGQIFWAMADTVNANKCFKELMGLFFSYTQNNFSYLSEPEQAFFYRNNKHFLDLAKGYYQYLYFQKGYRDEYIARSLYEINLNNKGVLLNSSSKLVSVIYAKGDTSLIKEYIQIRNLKERRNRNIQNGELNEVAFLDFQITEKEKSLRSYLSIESEKYVRAEDVIRAIPDSTNLVDVLKCKVYKLDKVQGSKRDSVMALTESQESRYLYFIFSKNAGLTLIQNEVEAKALEGRFYKAYLNFAKSNLPNSDIYDAYFKPLKKHLTSNNLIISGDGIYNLLNPEILFDGKGYLIDQYSFLSIVSAKDFFKVQVKKPVLKDITLIGWPDYSTHLKRYSEEPLDLPGTETEINGIRKTIPVSIGQFTYVRRTANEVTVKDIPSTSILHFATHGFFEVSTLKDPMHTSGLVLALSDSSKNDEDGYLTAYEASNLDLKKTFLVVLSACETGQGEFEEGEGVWGLQRAFQVAGVRYIVMSLFKVDDAVTSLLMQQFYSNMIRGDEVLTAFRKAQMKVKLKFNKPVEWGAFVVKGF